MSTAQADAKVGGDGGLEVALAARGTPGDGLDRAQVPHVITEAAQVRPEPNPTRSTRSPGLKRPEEDASSRASGIDAD
jgi:hypothetical protein